MGKLVFEQCWGITAQLILENFGQVIFALSCCHKSLEEKLGMNMNDFVPNIDSIAIAVAEGAYLVFYLPVPSCQPVVHCHNSLSHQL